MKTALIMEGGAMRGMFTCGVLDVLLRKKITFDAAAGISAGAVFGCNFKSAQIGRALRYNKKYCGDWRYCSLRSLLLTGDLYGADFCYRTLPDELDVFDRQAFQSNPMKFFVGATDVKTGRCIYHECTDGNEDDMLWLRASASMPLVSRPVAVNGTLLLDGGIADAVPFAYMKKLGYEQNVIILTQPRNYRKMPLKGKALYRLLLHKYPSIYEALCARYEMYNRQMDEIDRREQDGISLVLRPPQKLAIGHREKNPEKLEQVYRVGEAEAIKRLQEIDAFLKKNIPG